MGKRTQRTPNMKRTVASRGFSKASFAFSHAAMSACLSSLLILDGGEAEKSSNCFVSSVVAILNRVLRVIKRRQGDSGEN